MQFLLVTPHFTMDGNDVLGDGKISPTTLVYKIQVVCAYH